MTSSEIAKAQRTVYLIGRFNSGVLDIAEAQELEDWKQDSPGNLALFEELVDGEQRKFAIGKMQGYDTERALLGIKERMRPVSRDRKLFRVIGIAAGLVLVAFSIFYFYPKYREAHLMSGNVFMKTDLAPGRNTAMLTLSNGETISLSDGKTGIVIDGSSLKYSDGSKVQVSSGSQSLGPQKSGQSITGPVRDPSLYTEKRDPSLYTKKTDRSFYSKKVDALLYSKTSGKNPVVNGGVQTLMASTPRGGQYQVVLPDGTKVWLNAASSLKFPSSFKGLSRRIVELSGEAYFEVATSYVTLSELPSSGSGSLPSSDSSHGSGSLLNSSGSSTYSSRSSLRGRRTKQSFIVKTANQEVEVLGTHFNISSYVDDISVKTTLLEGSVKVWPIADSNTSLLDNSHTSLRGGTTTRQSSLPFEIASSRSAPRNDLRKNNNTGISGVILKPGQQAYLSNGGIKVAQVDAEDAVAWKDGEFKFNSEEISGIMKKVARWYDVEVIYEDNVGSVKLTGSVSRFERLSKLLGMLENTKEVRFKVDGKKIIVSKNHP